MQKGFSPIIIVAIVAVLGLGGAAFWFMRQAPVEGVVTKNDQSSTSSPMGGAASVTNTDVKNFLASGKSFKCVATMSDSSDMLTYYYGDADHMHAHLKLTMDYGLESSHVAKDGQYHYHWSDNSLPYSNETANGEKYLLTDMNGDIAKAYDDPITMMLDDADKVVCESWKVDTTQFKPSAQMVITDGAKILERQEKAMEAGDDLAACNEIPEEDFKQLCIDAVMRAKN